MNSWLSFYVYASSQNKIKGLHYNSSSSHLIKKKNDNATKVWWTKCHPFGWWIFLVDLGRMVRLGMLRSILEFEWNDLWQKTKLTTINEKALGCKSSWI